MDKNSINRSRPPSAQTLSMISSYLRCSLEVVRIIKTAIGRCINYASMFIFLTTTLYCLRTQIHANLFHKWSSSFLFSTKHQYVALTTMHGHHSWVEASCAGLLATVGYNSISKYSWLLIMPWLIRVALYWGKRTIAFGEMCVNVGEAENAGEILFFLMFINLVHLMVLIEVSLYTWWKFQRMVLMDRQVKEMKKFKEELSELMEMSPVFNTIL